VFDNAMAKKPNSNQTPAGGAHAQPELVTLTHLRDRAGAANEATHTDLYAAAVPSELQDSGTRVASDVLLGAATTFAADVLRIEAKLTATQKARLIGYDHGMPSVLIAEAIKLEGVYSAFSQQNPELAREQARRRADFSARRTRAQALRGQVTRALTNAIRGDASAAAAIETTTAAADTQGGLSAVLEALAREVRSGARRSESRDRFARRGLNEAYAAELDDAASTLRAAEQAQNAVATRIVTQAELDQQDGRVLLAVEAIWRPFRDAHAIDSGIDVPDLGAIEGLFVHSSGAKAGATATPSAGAGGAAPATPTPGAS
jgi:hypothetical protein